MPNDNEFFGTRDLILEMHSDIKTLVKSQAVTEERMKMGSNRFADHEVRIKTIEDRECPEISYAGIGWAIGTGFTIIGILIAAIQIFGGK